MALRDESQAPLLKKLMKRKKYGNKSAYMDGVRFDSKKEAARWRELKLKLEVGLIRDLQRQVEFELKVNDVLICKYVADFTYRESVYGPEFNAWYNETVEDVKSKATRTALYKLKKTLMFAIHGITIKEV